MGLVHSGLVCVAGDEISVVSTTCETILVVAGHLLRSRTHQTPTDVLKRGGGGGARELLAKARVPGFNSPAATEIFFHILPLLLSSPL